EVAEGGWGPDGERAGASRTAARVATAPASTIEGNAKRMRRSRFAAVSEVGGYEVSGGNSAQSLILARADCREYQPRPCERPLIRGWPVLKIDRRGRKLQKKYCTGVPPMFTMLSRPPQRIMW